MRYVSLFSGVEAATVAWRGLGWEAVAFSEIEPFPCAVLESRFPEVPNLGDVTEIDWGDFIERHGRPDLLVGGSPCQSFSIAGTRTGLEGESGLMWEYVRAVRELRPRWVVWENVPGALSSSNGEDFRCLLESLDELGYGLAWRVLDAQFFGVAQRRRRLFLVGCLGDAEGAAEVLFERKGVPWNPGPSAEKRKALASGAGGGSRAAGFKWFAGAGARGIGYCEDASPTLAVSDSHAPAVLQIAGNIIGRKPENGGHQVGIRDPEEDGAFTLTTADRHAVIAPTAKTVQVRCGKEGGGKGALVQDDVSATLNASNQQTLFAPKAVAANQRGEVRFQGGDGEVTGAIPASQSGKQFSGIQQGYEVRRLTPLECERLQGFPDDWTLIPWKGKPAEECPDGPRYKAMGNSMAVPVMRWIGERIGLVELL